MFMAMTATVAEADGSNLSQHLKPEKIEKLHQISQSILTAGSKKGTPTSKEIRDMILDIQNSLSGLSGESVTDADNLSQIRDKLTVLKNVINIKVGEIQASASNKKIDSNSLIAKLSGVVSEIDDILNNTDSIDTDKVSGLISRITPAKKPFTSDNKGLSGKILKTEQIAK
jgi:DNA polymerase II small subunit/DNA polymerase delta subunit B